ncbi:MAG: 7-cyano-7-deazaguanine synthase [Planctomycetota bacterium]
MSRKKRAVVCLSGGMDSTSLLLRLLAEGRQVFGLIFDYGQKHRIELNRLKQNLNYLRDHDIEVDSQILDMSKLGTLFHSALTDSNWTVPTGHYEQENMKQTVVPNRNAIFSSIAYGYALSIAVESDADVDFCLGVHSGDHAIYPDCRPEFYEAIFHAFSVGNWESEKVHLHIPYIEMDKTAILKDAAESIDKLKLDFDTIFRNTCTSYQPDREGKSHGLTGSDVERILAFHKFGRPDPLEYREPWETVLNKALEIEHRYWQDRDSI